MSGLSQPQVRAHEYPRLPVPPVPPAVMALHEYPGLPVPPDSPAAMAWHEYARLPVPPDDPALEAWGEAGETMFPGLPARERQRDTASALNGREETSTPMRTLILTDRRIVVLDENEMLETSIALGGVEDASVSSVSGGSNGGSMADAILELVVGGRSEPHTLRWTTARRDAEVFAEMVRERIDANEPEHAPEDPGPPPPKTGYAVPIFDTDVAEIVPAEPLPDGLRFGEDVIPWSDFDRIAAPEPGTMTFTLRLGSPSCKLVPGWVIRVTGLGDAEAIWRAFISDHRRGGERSKGPSRSGAVEAEDGEP